MAQEVLSLDFADGSYDFKLTIAGVKEIQEKCGCGIGRVWSRLDASRLNFMGEDTGVPQEAQFNVEDIIEPIRQGLLGGGGGIVDGQYVKMTPGLATRLINAYGPPERPAQEFWAVAYAVVATWVTGYDPPKKKLEENETTTDGSITPQP